MQKIIAIFLVSLLLLSGCTKEEAPQQPILPQPETEPEQPPTEPPVVAPPEYPLKGVSVSPKSFEETDFVEFMKKVGQTQDVLLWAGDWMGVHTEGAPKTFTELASQYDYVPIIEVGHYTQQSGDLLRPMNEENKKIYLDSTVAFAEKYQPEYFGIGVEINVFAEKNPADFEEFVVFYNEVYGEIKKVSPNTKVFTVFQLEKMKGLTMWELEESEPQWEMIDRFNSDIVAFTTYPGLFYRDPSDIPQDHYTEIELHTTKPIAFTEIGWHSAPSPEGWESSEEEQVEFINRFFELTKGMDVEVEVWSFMYSPDIFEPFDSMGLLEGDEETSPAFEAWTNG